MGYLIFQVLGQQGQILKSYKISTISRNGRHFATLSYVIDARLEYAVKWRGTTYYIRLPNIEYYSQELVYIMNASNIDILVNIMFNPIIMQYYICAIEIIEKRLPMAAFGTQTQHNTP